MKQVRRIAIACLTLAGLFHNHAPSSFACSTQELVFAVTLAESQTRSAISIPLTAASFQGTELSAYLRPGQKGTWDLLFTSKSSTGRIAEHAVRGVIAVPLGEEAKSAAETVIWFQPESDDPDTAQSFLVVRLTNVVAADTSVKLLAYSQRPSVCVTQGQEDSLNANGGVSNGLTKHGVTDVPNVDRLPYDVLVSLAEEPKNNE